MMLHTEPIIAVDDVQKSARFYETLLGAKSILGSDDFEIIQRNQVVILNLHKWGEEEHPSMIHQNEWAGNGLILLFRTENLDEIVENARRMKADIVRPVHFNKNSKKNQFTLRDPDGYYLIVSE